MKGFAMKSLLSVAAVMILAAGCVVVNKPAYDTLIAHRGESYDAPENTMPAFKMAVDRGFGFECDIYLSADKKLFTFHDNNLNRTTGGKHKEKCIDASWKDTISKINVGGWGKWKGSEFDPTGPALLEDVLKLACDGRYIYVEVKGGDPSWVPYIKEVFAKQSNATPKNVLFISFSKSVCAELKRQMSEYRVYWLTGCKIKPDKASGRPERKYTPEEIIAVLGELGVDGVDIRFDPEVIDAAFVKKIKEAGYSFHAWTIDNLKTAETAFSRGVETVTTNCAKKMLDEYAAR
jgi:glycerophosphoryl diester phosphodiesterase